MKIVDAATRAAVGEVLARYCRAIDRRRWELAADCFHDDATYSFGSIDGGWREFIAAARAMVDPLPMTHHQLGQTSIAAESEALAVETYFTATHLVPAGAAAEGLFAGRGRDYHLIVGGRYADRFTARGGAWRIERRVGTIDWRHEAAPLSMTAAV